MQYRKFGNTGEDISALGFGCMRLPEYEADGQWFIDQEKTNELLKRAYELGVNYFDTAPLYCHNNSPKSVGIAVKPFRNKVMLTTKLPTWDLKETDDYKRMLEQYLIDMDTDYIDFFHFWGIGRESFDERIVKLNLIREATRCKDEGLVRHICFSFHDEPSAIKYIIDRAPEMETMLVQYNLIDRANEDMIAYAAEKGVGVVAMGPVGGGRLSAPTNLHKGHSKATYDLAMRFVLGNKNIACALAGMENIEMLEQNEKIASLETPMTDKEWNDLTDAIEQTKKFSDLYCTGCKYCIECPQKIDIARVFEIYTHYNVYGLTESAKNAYKEFKNDKNRTQVSDCTKCGFCEEKCPQKLEVIKLLDKVDGILSGL